VRVAVVSRRGGMGAARGTATTRGAAVRAGDATRRSLGRCLGAKRAEHGDLGKPP
jgi:hypothetical protein